MIDQPNYFFKFERLLDKASHSGLSKKTKIEDVCFDLLKSLKKSSLHKDSAFLSSTRVSLLRISESLKRLNLKFSQIDEIFARIHIIQRNGERAYQTFPFHAYGIEPEEFDEFMEGFFSLESVNKQGLTPLNLAISKKNINMVNLLLDLGADPNKMDGEGASPLRRAAQFEVSREIFEALKKHGADFNFIDKDRWTTLGFAVGERKLEIVKILVELGANVNTVFKMREESIESDVTPLIIATAKQYTEIAEFLESKGADKELAQNYLREKFLFQVWGIGGKAALVKDGVTYEFNAAGSYRQIVLKDIGTYLRKFFESGKCDFLSKKDQSTIQQAIDSAFPNTSETAEESVSRLRSGQPIAILGGSSGHTVSLVLFQDRLAICNRGEGRTALAVEYYSLPGSEINEDLIKGLRKIYPTTSEFQQYIKELKLKPLKGFQQKDQKIGNCNVASAKGIVGVLLRMLTDNMTGRALYKQFASSLRRNVLEDFVADFTLEPSVLEKLRIKADKRGLIVNFEKPEKPLKRKELDTPPPKPSFEISSKDPRFEEFMELLKTEGKRLRELRGKAVPLSDIMDAAQEKLSKPPAASD